MEEEYEKVDITEMLINMRKNGIKESFLELPIGLKMLVSTYMLNFSLETLKTFSDDLIEVLFKVLLEHGISAKETEKIVEKMNDRVERTIKNQNKKNKSKK